MAHPMATLIQQADAQRKSLNWPAAAQSYSLLHQRQPDNAVVTHNLALCHLALQQWDLAIHYSQHALRHNPQQWQSALVLAKAFNKNNQQNNALQLLEKLHQHLPQQSDVRQELAHLRLHHLGQARAARQLIAPQPHSAPPHQDALLLNLVSQLYDREPGHTAALNQAFLDFAPHHLQLPPDTLHGLAPHGMPRHAAPQARPRIGLLSPQFFASPVYFLCIGSLRQLSQHADLVFFSRSHKQDWAAQEFKRIAHAWHDVVGHSASQLARHIAAQSLDSLLDLGGWMDPVALQALSAKPAPRQYKWVGGQSITTGLRSFDGYLSDEHQTPAGSDHLYSEPLIRLRSGYVTYTAPPYMPAPQAPRQARMPAGLTLGVSANPAKVSGAFLHDLGQRMAQWQTQRQAPIDLHFIDKRYQHPAACQRIRSALPGIEVDFITPATHRDYLRAIGQLDAIVDTFPYSGGLTTLEGLALGVPTLTRAGQLFCERHTLSHAAYAGLPPAAHHIDHWDCQQPQRPTGSLLPPGSPRLNHAQLARELLQTLHPSAA